MWALKLCSIVTAEPTARRSLSGSPAAAEAWLWGGRAAFEALGCRLNSSPEVDITNTEQLV